MSDKEPVMLWVMTDRDGNRLPPAPDPVPLPADRKVDRVANECSVCELVYKPEWEYCPTCGSQVFVQVKVTNHA